MAATVDPHPADRAANIETGYRVDPTECLPANYPARVNASDDDPVNADSVALVREKSGID